ncbi:MAG: sulfatase-like hydrolase/transferase [Aggregatilineales bacterium]
MASRPNILVIMDDQHRFDYLGCAGADFVQTPNIDRLAANGVRFTQCTTNAPICAPARIGLATGMQPSHLGALDNTAYLPADATTYYKRLRDADYRVGLVGKLDLAKPFPNNGRYGDRPRVYGFGFTHPEECEGKMHAASSPEPFGPYTYFLHERGFLQAFHEDYQKRAQTDWIQGASHDSVLPVEAFEDVYIGQRATRWIENIPDDYPWHLFVSFVGPHDPFDPPTAFADRYRHATMPDPIPPDDDRPRHVHARRVNLDTDEVMQIRRQYCALITLIDEQIGAILYALDRRGMTENTLIIFVSDHGEMLGDHALYKKHVAYEPAMRVPLIVSGLGIEGGRVNDSLIELIDLNPTICEMAGLSPQPGLDAESFAPILRGETTTHRQNTVTAERHYRAIRTHQYKLIQNYNDIFELYDLEDDPYETHNIADENDTIVSGLYKQMSRRFMRPTPQNPY